MVSVCTGVVVVTETFLKRQWCMEELTRLMCAHTDAARATPFGQPAPRVIVPVFLAPVDDVMVIFDSYWTQSTANLPSVGDPARWRVALDELCAYSGPRQDQVQTLNPLHCKL